jgi:hypothetical protein
VVINNAGTSMKSGYTREKILIWAKTYPELSSRYLETVCTAGLLPSGNPLRLYPIPYRYLGSEKEQFSLYQWITADIQKKRDDYRPESFRIDCDSIQLGEVIPATQDEWGKRAEFIFRDPSWHFDSVDDLQNAQKEKGTSIGVVAPREIKKVEIIARSEEDAKSFEQKLNEVKKIHEAKRAQINMFEQAIPPEMKTLEFLKSRVHVSWLCYNPTCDGHRMQVLDWGLCELQRRDGDEKALKRMKELCRLDIYDLKFFLGNLFLHPASFLIVGMWYPKLRPDMLKFIGGQDVS